MKVKAQPIRTPWDRSKAVLIVKFVAMSAYIKRTEKSQINDLMLHLKLLEKTRRSKSQNKQERNNKNNGEINEIDTQKNIYIYTENQQNKKLVL
jgi:hypothetical protein